MRVCAKCGTVNKDERVICAECQSYIGAVKVTGDSSYAKQSVEAVAKKTQRKNLIHMILFIVIYLSLGACMIPACLAAHGNLNRLLILLPFFIPCAVLFFFPYDRVYRMILRKRGKPDRYLSESWTIFFRVLAWLSLVVMYVQFYDNLARV